MKTLDRYILFSFLRTFLSVFMILILIFTLYIVWSFIKDLAGKDLDIIIIAKFIFYILPSLVPLILPLTILVTSIMTFGNFSENYEFATMKSAGISLQRAMGSLIVFIVVLGYVTYQFSNTVIPWAEFKSLNLRKNLAQVKPAMAIDENRFSDIASYVIKVEKKTGENEEILNNVIIHEKSQKLSGNHTVIKSKTGELISGNNPNLVSLVLNDGNYYNEIPPKNYKERQSRPFVKTSFDEYVLNIDISELNKTDLTDESATHPYKALNTDELRTHLDSFSQDYVKNIRIYNRLMNQRNGYSNLFKDSNKKDKIRNKKRNISVNDSNTQQVADSIKAKVIDPKGFYRIDSLIFVQPNYTYSQIYSLANNSVGTLIREIKTKQKIFANKTRLLNRVELELHRKYALGISCIVLFFVGAPLGAIIRKGGLGLPLVVSILLFLAYHFFGIFAGNSSETGGISPFLGAWLSTLVMMPLGVYLTYRATTDQGFINTDAVTDPIKKILRKLKLIKPDDEND
ncbi:LptF/LptG family permease [Flavobacterium sp. CS20]|uniref:LptF/LptG family permease n=1 Tax=Flavobacterium sp. CS20 TaxID=2775246 RepID=UPI001B39D9FE|nr:LptF/LptG family permease [Flavobacterium sp. CS20]QTY27112.1 LptF/LptG family permease [Flavobacterium sp. CS20]